MGKIIYIDQIPVTVEYRRVKNVNLYLKPPDGQVLVTAPRQVPLKRIREFVEGKADWIRKHQERMQRAVASREAEPELSRAQRDLLREKVAYYAGKLCISPKYLSRVVASVSGRRPVDWIRDYVVLEAKALLKSGKYTVQQVADILHFPNQSFFGTYFKKATGISPMAYKEA